MDIYIATKTGPTDPNFTTFSSVDDFSSFIWTERYSGKGEFEITMTADDSRAGQFQRGRYLRQTESDRTMLIEEIYREDTPEGSTVKISGRSLEYTILSRRTVFPNNFGYNYLLKDDLSGEAIRKLVYRHACDPTFVNAVDVVPGLSARDLVTSEFGIPYEGQLEIGSLFDRVKELCDYFEYGFRIVHGGTEIWRTPITFEVYRGEFRSRLANGQFPPSGTVVAFGRNLENLTSSRMRVSDKEYYNVCNVIYGDEGQLTTVHLPYGSVAPVGFNRRVMTIRAEDIKYGVPTVAGAVSAAKQRGYEALASQKQLSLVDGDLATDSKFTYGVDYKLGDIVEIWDDRNNFDRVRVVEYIWSLDAEGLKTYPTLQEVE